MKHCASKKCIFHYLTIFANLAVIVIILFFASQAYGSEARIALMFLIPPILSLKSLSKKGDKEERELKKRIRKANLRKELGELKEFDK